MERTALGTSLHKSSADGRTWIDKPSFSVWTHTLLLQIPRIGIFLCLTLLTLQEVLSALKPTLRTSLLDFYALTSKTRENIGWALSPYSQQHLVLLSTSHDDAAAPSQQFHYDYISTLHFTTLDMHECLQTIFEARKLGTMTIWSSRPTRWSLMEFLSSLRRMSGHSTQYWSWELGKHSLILTMR